MKFALKIEDKNLEIEHRKLAEQANGSVMAKLGDTLVLATAVMSEKQKEGMDFFPLTVEYEEKYYAAGRIKRSRFIKREGRPSDEAICTARFIDRAIRPLFNKNIKNEVQIITTVLSWDGENDPDILGLIAVSTSLLISDIDWQGPVAAVRVGKINDNFIVNPNYQEREKEENELDIVFAGVEKNGELLVNMIEGEANEADEKDILGAFDFAKKYLKEIIDFQKETSRKIGLKEKKASAPAEKEIDLEKELKEILDERLKTALFKADKKERKKEIELLKQEVLSLIEEKYPGKESYGADFFDNEINEIIHEAALKEEKRVDGRKIDQLREITCEAGVLPRIHGSGIFSRGETRSLSILTLGAPGDQQFLEGMEIVGKKRFMHHYNFPPYSTGEVRPLRGPGRREIGHGVLAEKALASLIPSFEEFPYTIRIVSEIVSSNGSTSMASVCSSSLALMDAGVPIKRPVAGIAIGLMADKKLKNFKILTDIQGPEDHYGDMDFKVAGTKKGITAIQMDVKITGINVEIMKEALVRAKKARLEIIDKIEKVLPKPRTSLSPFAPRIITLQINPDKIREVIGPGGKVINGIIEETGTIIDIEDNGLIFITSEKREAAEKAASWIKNIVREVKVGEVFQGKVNRILDFGAFVEILPGQDGLIHISKLSPRRVRRVEDVVKIGDIVSVKVISIDEQGRINLALLNNNNKKKKN